MKGTSRISHRRISKLQTFHAFNNASYRILWPASFSSYIARWMQVTILVWLVLDLTGSPFQVALVGFFGMLPVLLLGMVGGVLADNVNRQRLLITTQGMNFTASVAMAVALYTGQVQFWHAYLAILITGTGWALDNASRRSLMHDLLGRSGVTNAVALDMVAMSSSRMLGPAIAGGLIALIDVAGGYIVVTFLYATSLILSRVLRLAPGLLFRRASDSKTDSLNAVGDSKCRSSIKDRTRLGSPLKAYRDLARGFGYVKSQDVLLATVSVTALMNFMLFPYLEMVPVVAREVLGVGPALMGILMAADGFGALAGAIIVASTANINYHGRLFIGGSMVALLALVAFSLSNWYLLSFLILLVLGLGSSGFGTMQSTIVMLTARQEMRGRALGVTSVAIGMSPLGALFIGGVATVVSPTFAIGLNGGLAILLLTLIVILMPSLRQRFQTTPER